MTKQRELGRGERVLPGLWRLRLPLPWPGVPHCNAWAIAAGSGIVLIDTGMHLPGSLAQLERAMEQVNLRLEHVRLLACTHAHSDHWGQAAPIIERAGCELWMHPRHEHATRPREDPEAALERRIEVGRQSGVPEKSAGALRRPRAGDALGRRGAVSPDRPLVPGVEIESDLGAWTVYETPGHAPSHVCLFQPERRLLISGDHLLGRISLYYDYGWTPTRSASSCTRWTGSTNWMRGCVSPGTVVRFWTWGPHRGQPEAGGGAAGGAGAAGPRGADGASRDPAGVYGEAMNEYTASWWLSETLSYLRHLEVRGGRAERDGVARCGGALEGRTGRGQP